MTMSSGRTPNEEHRKWYVIEGQKQTQKEPNSGSQG